MKSSVHIISCPAPAWQHRKLTPNHCIMCSAQCPPWQASRRSEHHRCGYRSIAHCTQFCRDPQCLCGHEMAICMSMNNRLFHHGRINMYINYTDYKQLRMVNFTRTSIDAVVGSRSGCRCSGPFAGCLQLRTRVLYTSLNAAYSACIEVLGTLRHGACQVHAAYPAFWLYPAASFFNTNPCYQRIVGVP